MRTNELNTKSSRSELLFFTLVCLAAMFAMLCISAVMYSQEPIKLAPKSKFNKVQTFKNSQGFMLPVSVSDTTKVYQIGSGPMFYYRQSKKTGNLYKVYIVRWKDDIRNPANEEYVIQTAMDYGVSPDSVTQKMFNVRYIDGNTPAQIAEIIKKYHQTKK